jgi:hypothetical protein
MTLLPQQDLARCAQSYEVKRRFAKIDAYRMNMHVDDPLLEPANTILYGSVEPQAADHLIIGFSANSLDCRVRWLSVFCDDAIG